MHNKYLPHNMLGFKSLQIIWTVFFYATLVFGVYAAYNWILVLQLPAEYWQINSAPLIRIYGFAAGAALLVCLAELGVLRTLALCKKAQETVCKK